MVAVPLDGEERARTWGTITSSFPFFLEHEARAGRAIPLVALLRRPAARGSDRFSLENLPPTSSD